LALAWTLRSVLLLFFAGALVALALQRICGPLQRRLGIKAPWALTAVIVTVVAVMVLGGWLVGSRVLEQVESLRETLPRAFQALLAWLQANPLGAWLLQLWRQADLDAAGVSSIASLASAGVSGSMQAVGGVVLVVVLAVYLAADPELYRRGFLRLLPATHRAHADATLQACANELSRWMLGQASTMLIVGCLTAGGLALIGMPLAVSLGLIAGLLEFVPYFGTFVSSVLIIMVAFSEGETMVLYAAAVCAAVQMAEAYVVMPLTQRWAVRLPTVLSLLSVLIFGVLFGVAGVLLAVPLMVLTMTLVSHLWLRRPSHEGELVRQPVRPRVLPQSRATDQQGGRNVPT
jgi:predicted PurR-regulated permease PerM